MGKLFLFVLIVVVAVLLNPTLRGKVAPHAEGVLSPVYEWSTRSRMKEMQRALEAEQAAGRGLPDKKTFSQFLRDHYPGQDSTDAWGTAFYVRQTRRDLVVGSAGRDRVVGNADDIKTDAIPLRN